MKSGIQLQEALPEFARELYELLQSSKEQNLVTQLPELRIRRRCSCEDDFCATFYTQFEPVERPFPDHHCIVLEPTEGMIILDVVAGQIAEVEVLYRDDVRKPLRVLFP